MWLTTPTNPVNVLWHHCLQYYSSAFYRFYCFFCRASMFIMNINVRHQFFPRCYMDVAHRCSLHSFLPCCGKPLGEDNPQRLYKNEKLFSRAVALLETPCQNEPKRFLHSRKCCALAQNLENEHPRSQRDDENNFAQAASTVRRRPNGCTRAGGVLYEH